MTDPGSAHELDVAIVGGGPVGVLLANLLGLQGLRTAVFEREAQVYPLPRAIHFDGEVMRVFETAGLRTAVEAVARPGLKGMHFVNAQGQTLLIRGGTAREGPHGCATNHYFHQPELEAVLRQGLARFAHVQLRLQHEVTDLAVHADGAGLQVRGPDGGLQRWRARQVVGCDGARSLVRRLIGGGSLDLGLHQPWLVFDVRLSRERPDLPDHTVQHCDPARPRTFCHVTGDRRRWEIMLMPGDDPAELVRPERIWPLVAPWMGPADATIERAVIYTFHSVIAQGWRRGPLLLAGDSAHQTPPFLGQGLCAGVRDAANLAWKLADVARGRVQGAAAEALLDSYGAERKAHVRALTTRLKGIGAIICERDPQRARERDARLLAECGGVVTGTPRQDVLPRLESGLLAAADTPGRGTLFPQPRLVDGALMDGRCGHGWRLVLDAAWPGTVPEPAGLVTLALGDPAQAERDGVVAAWMQRHGCRAAVIRPDHYVYGTALDAAGLDAVLAQRSTALGH